MSSDKETGIKGTPGQLDGVLIESRGLGKGASFSGYEINHLWLNDAGRDFLYVSGISGADHDGDSRSMAVLDYDRDGYSDFVMVNANRPTLQLYRNNFGDMLTARGKQAAVPIYVQFVGGNRSAKPSTDWAPRDGYGAKVWVEVEGKKWLREFRCGEGLGAQNSNVLALGIGSADKADSLTVLWPNGKEQVIRNAQAGLLYTVYENPAETPTGAGFVTSSRLKVERPAKRISEGGPAKVQGHSPELERLMAGKSKAPVRLVMTWFADCAACKKYYPTVNAVRAAFAEDELGVLGFNNAAGDGVKAMEASNQKYGVRFLNLAERTKSDIEALKVLMDAVLPPLTKEGKTELPSRVTPVTLVVDEHGNVLRSMYGFPTVSEVTTMLHDLGVSRH